MTIALVALAVGLAVASWPRPWGIVGAMVILVVVGFMAPRPGGLRYIDHARGRPDLPALFGLCDRIGAALGSRPPAAIVVDRSFNASWELVGWPPSERSWPKTSVGWRGPFATSTATGRDGVRARSARAHWDDAAMWDPGHVVRKVNGAMFFARRNIVARR